MSKTGQNLPWVGGVVESMVSVWLRLKLNDTICQIELAYTSVYLSDDRKSRWK